MDDKHIIKLDIISNSENSNKNTETSNTDNQSSINSRLQKRKIIVLGKMGVGKNYL